MRKAKTKIKILNGGAAVWSLAVAILMAAHELYGFAAISLFIGLLNALAAFRRS